MTASLSDTARGLLGRAVAAYGHRPATVAHLRGHLARLDEPLRVAVAGRVKAGKSTLLNALVGDRLAPTDAGECTRVVTWFRDGRTPSITMHPLQGKPIPLTIMRERGALVIELGTTPAASLDHVTVEWPSQELRGMTLIDTPGIASLTEENSQRTLTFLDPDDDETPTEADAVVYLMRHLHIADAQFLESFRDRGVARATAVNTVAVLSRADEIGAGRVDALYSARAIAQRYRTEPEMRALCQDVVAVAGLIAETGRTLHSDEFRALRDLAGDRDALEKSLRSADRFLQSAATEEDGPSRGDLLGRFGLYGVRLAVTLIRNGASTPAELATELVDRSGLPELQRLLHVQFTERRDLLKARSALLALDGVLRAEACPDRWLPAELERVLAGAHEFVELHTLSALRSGAVRLPRDLGTEAERLLGGTGRDATTRLGLAPDAGARERTAAAAAALTRWQHRAADPMLDRAAERACRAVVRSCEGLLTNRSAAGTVGAR